ncbi:MAG TPA: FAD-dependent oxidoreductase [Thermohalobaculum sp.]|nr:FAD-dependent oxidoreductase [Thermohalobaculum sp.]
MRLTPDLCIIGAGSGGLTVAAGAAQLGAEVVLVEGGRMGGDCLNYGCVPSKALIAAASKAHVHRSSGPYGVAGHEPDVDYAAAMEHVARAIAAIAPHDSQERFEGLGVTVLRDWARFVSPDEVAVGGTRIAARRFVIATGSSPAVPPVPGLDGVPFLTNETLWENRTLPGHLVVIGGGPVGMEMAQAHRRLGSEVTVVQSGRALPNDDPEVAAVAVGRLCAEGVNLREHARAARVSGTAGVIEVALEDGDAIRGTHLLVAAGRTPNLARLDLEAGGIAANARGVEVDRGLRSTTNARVHAIGDAAGGLRFTHLASHHGGLVVRNALFRLPVRASTAHVPWATYTDPEVAHVGLTEAAAREAGHAVEVHRAPFSGNDRAIAMGETEGLAKIVVGRRGRILGASIVGPDAGELISLWAFAIHAGRKIGAVAGYVAPYPTLGEVSKRAAGAYYQSRLFENPWAKRAVRLLARLG